MTRNELPWLILAQLFVTLALILFAFPQPEAIKTLIVGAVIANWLKEGTHLGQQVAENRAERQQQQGQS